MFFSNRAKSVYLTENGIALAQKLLQKYTIKIMNKIILFNSVV
ncbi:DUF6429 family protein [Gottfriedia acidiceleris]